MFSIKSLLAASATFSFVASSAASKNVAVYWGSGANQQRLSTFCDETDIDIIPIGFLELFPQQGNGFPKENFGNACWGGSVYYGPGSDHDADQLYTQCPTVQEDIPYCQSKGKKIVLSLGGDSKDYQLTGAAAGIQFADFLWGAYGPLTSAWKAAGGIRPLDRGASNTSSLVVEVDGFDFDIEHAATDLSIGYIACIQRLRTLFATGSKQYLITGAPQCFLPEVNMGSMIAQAQFDILFIQFYNNPSCSASNFANNGIDINYNTWKSEIAGGASSGAQLYIGLVGAPTVGTDCEKSSYGEYIDGTAADSLIKKYQDDSAFGGIMLWEATLSLENECNCKPFYSVIKDSLRGISPPAKSAACPVTSTTTSASSTSTSTSATSSSSSVSSTLTSTSSSAPVISTTSSVASTSASQSSSDITTSSVASTSASQSSSDISTSSSASVTSTASSSVSTSSSESSTIPSTSSSLSVTSTVSSSSEISTSSSSSAPVTSLTSSSSSSAISSDISTSSGVSSSVTISSSSVEVTRSASSTLTSLSSSESSKFPTFTPPYGNGTKTTTSSATISPTIITSDASIPTGTGVTLTTSTVYTTKTGTVTKCPATVTNCPVGAVTTETIALYTTICPVANNGGVPTSSPVISAPPSGYTTSTVYTTKISTITSCAPGIACAGKPGDVVTEIIPLYTTVCPVAQGGVLTKAPSVSVASAAQGSPTDYSTSTIYSTKIFTVTACAPGVVCAGTPGSVVTQIVPISSVVYHVVSPKPSSASFFTTYVTIKVASSASSGTPLAPYPTPSKSHSKYPYGSGIGTAYSYTLKPTGTSAPSVRVEIVKVSPIPENSPLPGFTKAGGGAKAVAATGTPISPSATPSLVSTNSASGFGTSSVVAMIFALVVGFLMM